MWGFPGGGPRVLTTWQGKARGMKFVPDEVYIEEDALSYELGRRLLDRFSRSHLTPRIIRSGQRIPAPAGLTPAASYRRAKRVLVVSLRKTLDFQTCRPSAHYQLPLVTSCPGLCEYCYLQTTLGARPYIRVYANIEDILGRALRYVQMRTPETTVFEGAATSDPLAVEEYTGSVARAISFFAAQDHARFRFVTKFSSVEGILGVEHRGHTRVRFSVNTPSVIERYESGTPRLRARVEAATRASRAGYPIGFLIAPVMAYPGWEEEYRGLIASLAESVPSEVKAGLTFEIISHRYTPRARELILRRHPESTLPMENSGRRVRMGQFGYIKYVYPPEMMERIRALFESQIAVSFPGAKVEYLI